MKYSTVQKGILTEFLRSNSESARSADEIYKAIGGSIGKSTVYRLLSALADENIINRFAKENGKGVLYQYKSDGKCSGHLHMKCLKCDRMYHMDDENSDELLRRIKEKTNFDVSGGRTVLYGVCPVCGET